MKQIHRLLLITFITIMTGCSTAPKEPPVKESLYNRLGGEKAIVAVVQDFTERLSTNPKTKDHFKNSDLRVFKERLFEQICQASGGPCTYQGGDMKTVHKGMKITNEEFDITVQELVATLKALKVPKQEQDEILSVLGPMRTDIVEMQ